jgi:hypothetical protein
VQLSGKKKKIVRLLAGGVRMEMNFNLMAGVRPITEIERDNNKIPCTSFPYDGKNKKGTQL